MKKQFLFLWMLIAAFVFVGCSDDDDPIIDEEKETVVISFEGKLTEAESEFTTTEGIKDGYYLKTTFKDPENILQFNHYYGDWGFGGGFTYTNKTDVTTTDSNISAITGKGKYETTYLSSNTNDFTPAKIEILKSDDYVLKGAWITNTTYAYLTMKNGNSMSPAMADNDWFKLTIIGHKADGTKINSFDVYLGDYRNSKKEIVKEWIWVDFTPIAEAAYITFEMEGTVENESGPSLPTYFCIDGITLEER